MEELLSLVGIHELLIALGGYIAGAGSFLGWRLWRHRTYLTAGTEDWYVKRHRDRVAELARQALRNKAAREKAANGD